MTIVFFVYFLGEVFIFEADISGKNEYLKRRMVYAIGSKCISHE